MISRDRLFVTDLDGTLLGADSRVSRRSARIITELSRRGVLITVATARTPATVEPLLHDTLTVPPAVVLTGAALWDRPTLSYLSLTPLPSDAAADVTRTVGSYGLHPLVYTREPDNRHLTFFYVPATLTSDEMRFVDDRAHLELKRAAVTDDPVGVATHADVVLVLAMGPAAAVEAAAATLRPDPRLSVSSYTDPVYPAVAFLEVFGAGVSKADGLRRLRAATGARHITVFGDNLNDLPMMAEADRAIAVDNALPEVKSAVHDVIGPNTTDAVARYIAAESGVKIDNLL